MHARFLCKRMVMAGSRRKKLIVYGGFLAVLGFAFLHVTYFSEAYSPLQVLSDAQSEARRLLRFITLYHYQCNTTIQGVNISHWPVCTEKVGGLNLVLGGPRIMYSVGPTGDHGLERLLALNYSYNVNIFHHMPLSLDFQPATRNRTHIFKTTIVPNDPADYGRNSFDTQTLNNVFESFRNPVVDVLKIDLLSETSHSHELVYFMVKDRLLAGVRQLHLALYVDKVDDDYLYSWYKALYMLFHKSGFRLYHTSASDSLCLQVTLMESCVYYMTWIRDPGPETFILYPPAIDGTDEFEVDRLQDYMEDTEATCSNEINLHIPPVTTATLCMDSVRKNAAKPCQLVIFRNSELGDPIAGIPNSHCSVSLLEVTMEIQQGEVIFNVRNRSYKPGTQGNMATLEDSLQKLLPLTSTNMVYVDMKQDFWPLLTRLLDSGVLYNVDQLLLDVRDLWGRRKALGIRRRYSELQRVEAYGFRKFQVDDDKLVFHGTTSDTESIFKLNYLKVTSGRTS